ncbi:hypothetical protein E5676_scaffold429G00010 [Cucumis melo var. makuwa]|uniref:Uncharacterized protein n=1 Tax=Cucumis melo var. makuwa TaxID=1194695 RepID=A0A5D3BJX1_CUCMM|nr:hypothetical protein E5676_scaffold429G00010 [Cucumis melo var. makuwa]
MSLRRRALFFFSLVKVAPSPSCTLEKIKRPLYEKHPMSKFAWTIAEDTDTMEWYNICQDALRKVNESYQGKETADIIQNKAREEDEEIEFDCANYQLEIMRCLRELNVNDFIGWIGTSNIGGWRRYLGYFTLPAHELELVEDAECKFIRSQVSFKVIEFG